jgi:hypothetical protein
MKTKMKFFVAIVIMMSFTMGAMAQTTANANISGTATVTAGVTVALGSNLVFQNVVPGVTKTIDLKNVVSAGTATGAETTGYWTITKGASTQVTIGINTASVTYLSGTVTATDHLPIGSYTGRLRVGGTPAAPTSQSAITDFTSTSTSNTGGTIPFFAASTFYVDLGATVTPAANQPAGSYTADYTLTATYN